MQRFGRLLLAHFLLERGHRASKFVGALLHQTLEVGARVQQRALGDLARR